MSIEQDPEEPLPPRADLYAGLAWAVFGGAVLAGAWRMDRLEHLQINKYEVPGLVPGLLGAAVLVLGLVLALRAVARGALAPRRAAVRAPSQFGAMAQVFALTLLYALGMIGTGLPFWLATFAFVSVFVLVFDRGRQAGLGRGFGRQVLLALTYGAATSAVVSLSFEYIFLVRLP